MTPSSPYRHARQLPFQIESAIVQLKQEHPCRISSVEDQAISSVGDHPIS